jgi:predicted transcriptional regulator
MPGMTIPNVPSVKEGRDERRNRARREDGRASEERMIDLGSGSFVVVCKIGVGQLKNVEVRNTFIPTIADTQN